MSNSYTNDSAFVSRHNLSERCIHTGTKVIATTDIMTVKAGTPGIVTEVLTWAGETHRVMVNISWRFDGSAEGTERPASIVPSRIRIVSDEEWQTAMDADKARHEAGLVARGAL